MSENETMTAAEQIAAFDATPYGRALTVIDWARAWFPELYVSGNVHIADTGTAYITIQANFWPAIDAGIGEPDNWNPDTENLRVADHPCAYGGVDYSADGAEGTDAGACRWIAELAEKTRRWNAGLDTEWED